MTGESIVIFDAKESVDETAVTHIDFGRLDQTFANIGVNWSQAAD